MSSWKGARNFSDIFYKVEGVSLIKRGFHEIPHIMLGSVVFFIGVGFAAIGTRRHWKYEKHRRVWKRRYTVVREEDFDPNTQVHNIYQKYPWF